MSDQRDARILADLLRHEQCNLAPRLLESAAFVSGLSASAFRTIKQMARESKSHCEALVELVLILGGEPGPRGQSMQTADLHYVELATALPRLIQVNETLVAAYRSAANTLADAPEAAALVSRIADAHAKELAALRAMQPAVATGAA